MCHPLGIQEHWRSCWKAMRSYLRSWFPGKTQDGTVLVDYNILVMVYCSKRHIKRRLRPLTSILTILLNYQTTILLFSSKSVLMNHCSVRYYIALNVSILLLKESSLYRVRFSYQGSLCLLSTLSNLLQYNTVLVSVDPQCHEHTVRVVNGLVLSLLSYVKVS